MAKTMTPSGITKGQIGKFQDLLGDGLRKSDLQSDPIQIVIERQGDEIVAECIAVIRKRVEAVSNMIVRRVRVNRTRTPEKALAATGRRQYVDDSVVSNMPRGEGEEAEVSFFKASRYVSDVDLDKEFDSHGLKPVDPFTLAAVNEADPAFADSHPNGTHWRNADGKWCYIAFDRWGVGRDVRVFRDGGGWGGHWWFAGVRK